eukprot:scaffold8628_cov111-Isochrysis_galbana.AAC.5
MAFHPPAGADAEEFEAELSRLRDDTVEPLMRQYRQSGGGGAGVDDLDDDFFSGTEGEHDEL